MVKIEKHTHLKDLGGDGAGAHAARHLGIPCEYEGWALRGEGHVSKSHPPTGNKATGCKPAPNRHAKQ